LQKARPPSPHQPVGHARQLRHTSEQILIEQKEWLDGADLRRLVPDHEIPVRKIRAQGLIDQLVIAMILALMCKRPRPMRLAGKVGAGHDIDPGCPGGGARGAGRRDQLQFRH
jgi:hypothetical protein